MALRWALPRLAGACLALAVAIRASPAQAPASPDIVALGGALFRSTLLSADGTVACSTCHVPALGYSGDVPRAVGVGGFSVGRRAPALLDLGQAHALMWDGRAASLAEQVPLPLESPEMAVAWPQALRAVNEDAALSRQVTLAGLAPLDRSRVITALAAYVASLQSGTSRFDSYHDGGNPVALTEQEQFGYRLFLRKANCGSCHLATGPHPRFTDDGFHSVGIAEGEPLDLGRASVTASTADRWRFHTPSLRNVMLRPYLMHDGSLSDLRQVVAYYNAGGRPGSALQDARIVPLHLTEIEINALVAFLGTLTER